MLESDEDDHWESRKEAASVLVAYILGPVVVVLLMIESFLELFSKEPSFISMNLNNPSPSDEQTRHRSESESNSESESGERTGAHAVLLSWCSFIISFLGIGFGTLVIRDLFFKEPDELISLNISNPAASDEQTHNRSGSGERRQDLNDEVNKGNSAPERIVVKPAAVREESEASIILLRHQKRRIRL